MRYEIKGRVIDEFTSDGIGGVRVEAWDKDPGLDDYLGSASTIRIRSQWRAVARYGHRHDGRRDQLRVRYPWRYDGRKNHDFLARLKSNWSNPPWRERNK